MRSKFLVGAIIFSLLGLILAFSFPYATSFAQSDEDDPDMPRKFSSGLSKEEFKSRRARYFALKRGVEKDKPVDPADR